MVSWAAVLVVEQGARVGLPEGNSSRPIRVRERQLTKKPPCREGVEAVWHRQHTAGLDCASLGAYLLLCHTSMTRDFMKVTALHSESAGKEIESDDGVTARGRITLKASLDVCTGDFKEVPVWP